MRNKKPFNPDQQPTRVEPQQPQQRPAEPQGEAPRPVEPEPVEPEDEQQEQQEELAPVRPEAEEEEVEPIGLVDSEEPAEGSKRGHIKAFGSAGAGPAVGEKAGFQRTPNVTGQGAIRCRIFHSKIAEGPLSYMQNQINEWIDGEDIEVKHVGHMVGDLEGKTKEPNVIIMIWY
jgi:hypothetical protein